MLVEIWPRRRVMRDVLFTASRSVAGTLTAVDVEDRAGDERGVLKINHRVDDVAHLAHATNRVQAVVQSTGSRPSNPFGL